VVARPLLPHSAKLGGHAPMQVKIVNYLASSRGLSIFAQLRHTSPEILRNLLYDESIAALVTIYWLPRQAPAIYQGTRNVNYNAIKSMGGHTMLFASFNPDHLTVGSKSTHGVLSIPGLIAAQTYFGWKTVSSVKPGIFRC
jgi:hypothetical protein